MVANRSGQIIRETGDMQHVTGSLVGRAGVGPLELPVVALLHRFGRLVGLDTLVRVVEDFDGHTDI